LLLSDIDITYHRRISKLPIPDYEKITLSDLEYHSKLERRPSKRLAEDSEGERNRIYLLTTEYAKDTLRSSRDSPKSPKSGAISRVPSEPLPVKSPREIESKENVKSILKKSEKGSHKDKQTAKTHSKEEIGETPIKESRLKKTPTEETAPKKEKEKLPESNLENPEEKEIDRDEKKEHFMFHLLLAIRTSINEAKKSEEKGDKEIDQKKKSW